TEYPFGPASGGSTTTPSLTPAVRAAAIAGKKRMFDIASEMLKASAQDLDMRDGRIFVKADPSRNLTFKAVAAKIPGETTKLLKILLPVCSLPKSKLIQRQDK
ncbi:MAG: molybdopterin-dependent oxidoreductase, partial [Blastocatellia bacterium]|nr:molybdopterin-dependent oxidoreductase [Blastocatellia bacterium]